jgi:hypothetical protein
MHIALSAALVMLALAGGLHAAAPSGQFTSTGSGTVKDNQTGLEWQAQDDATDHTWNTDPAMANSAQNYCKSLSLAGKSDWRLPSLKELQTLIDDRAASPAIDSTFFPAVQNRFYWTSTPQGFAGDAWAVDFGFGIAFSMAGSSAGRRVRCVRSL